ncbi:MAG: PAS domain-containing protein, partial [Acidithiobacillus sp.]|nr:PAS domain-containing protein [Acidithiobacillus sp.]
MITSRTETLRLEQNKDTFYTALLNSLAVGFSVTRYPERIIEQVNETLLELFGASNKQQLVERQVREFYPDEDTYQKAGIFAESVLRDGHGLLRDVPYRRLDGTTMYMDLSGERFAGSDHKARVVWTHVDVTERHAQLETIRQLSKGHETLLANTAVGIALIGYPERVIVDANQAFVALLGYDSREEVVGKSPSFLYFDSSEDQRALDTARHILNMGQGSLRDLHALRKNGQDLYLDISGQRLEGEDLDHPVIVWTAIDVTERYRLAQYQSAAVLAQQELLRLNDPKAMYQRLVEIVVQGTSSICAYIATPGINGMWLQVAAIYSKNSILAQAIEQVIFSQNAAKYLYGKIPASIAFIEKKTQGPEVVQFQSFPMPMTEQQRDTLSLVKSIMAYPIFVGYQEDPAAVLVVEGQPPNYFTQPLQILLDELSKTLGISLTNSWHLQELGRSSKIQQTILQNTTSGILMVRYPERVVIKVNQTLLDLLGYVEDDVVGKKPVFLYPAEDEQRISDIGIKILDMGQGGLRDVHVLRK